MKDENIKEASKTFIIGIDGATFDLMSPWISEGKLPNLKKLMDNGAHGELQSSIPTNSAPAWTSIVTGKNPGKHGIFSFTSPNDDIGNIKITNSTSRASKSVWNIFSDAGKKSIVINVPLTYPPEEVDGVIISGMDTPNMDVTYTYPESITGDIEREFGNYKIEPEVYSTWSMLNDQQKQKYLDEVLEISKLHFNVTQFLMKKYPWDFSMVVFVATDRIQHKYWSAMDRNHPLFSEKENEGFGSAIFDTYKMMDDFVGRLMDTLPVGSNLFIVSDHGFGPRSNKVISVNKFLESKGLLQFKSEHRSSPARIISAGKSILFDLVRGNIPVKHQQKIKKIFPFLKGKAFSHLHFGNIDWSKTMAYAEEPLGLLWINDKKRFKKGIVEDGLEYEELRENIIKELKDLKDEETSKPILRAVYRREEVCSGPYLDEVPDIIFEYDIDYSFVEKTYASDRMISEKFTGTVSDERDLLQITGIHQPNGIFIAAGKHIKKGFRLKDISVVDVLPTCLYLAGFPVEKDMDGRVLTELIEDDFVRENPVRYAKDYSGDEMGKRSDGGAYSQEEQKQIEERLKSLGYL